MIKGIDVSQLEILKTASGDSLLTRGDSDDQEVAREVMDADVYGLKEHAGRDFKKILDLGGHIGSFAVKAATMWPEAMVVSLEAMPTNALLIRMNTNRFKNVRVIDKAIVSSNSSETSFFTSNYDWGKSNQASHGRTAESMPSGTPDSRQMNTLPAIGIFEIMDEYGPFDFVKMDIEGAELGILQALHAKGRLNEMAFIRGEFHHPGFLHKNQYMFGSTHEFGGYYIYENLGFFYANRW